jgi:hypothetical protein
MYDGASRVTSHGPAAAVASGWPLDLAAWANMPKALLGKPATCSGEVRRRENALVASRTLFVKAVDSCASCSAMALKRALDSPRGREERGDNMLKNRAKRRGSRTPMCKGERVHLRGRRRRAPRPECLFRRCEAAVQTAPCRGRQECSCIACILADFAPF